MLHLKSDLLNSVKLTVYFTNLFYKLALLVDFTKPKLRRVLTAADYTVLTQARRICK